MSAKSAWSLSKTFAKLVPLPVRPSFLSRDCRDEIGVFIRSDKSDLGSTGGVCGSPSEVRKPSHASSSSPKRFPTEIISSSICPHISLVIPSTPSQTRLETL
ncbi:hypothetical protein M758_UG085900 [Ceratodon purpureus]|nr:hypothetical protein M758_UG085900 [Ceratodon purpureus]